MKSIRSRSHLATALVLALAAAGCTESAAPGTAQTESEMREMHEMHGPPGPQILFKAALHHLDDLTADQRATIERAAASLDAKADPHAPIDGLRAEVAASVRAGAIDEAAILAKLDPGDSSSLATALDTLHATLTPAQRRELVDMMSKHLDDHAKGGDVMGHLLSAVDLTAEQRAKIEPILAAQAPAADHVQTMRDGLQAFASDRFDAAAFVRPMAMRDHVQRVLHALAAIVPVLDPAQREKLAVAIETHEP